MIRPISEKMGIKPGMRAIFINAPEDAVKEINPGLFSFEADLKGKFDYIHFFVNTQARFHDTFPVLVNHLEQTGMLWVSWPKSGQQGTDLTLTIIIKLGYDYGMVESKTISINSIWSALKFTHPKKGKIIIIVMGN